MAISTRQSVRNFQRGLLASALLAASLAASTGAAAKDAPDVKETGAWIVTNLLNLGQNFHMAPGIYGRIIAATSTECDLIVTTSIEMVDLEDTFVTKNEIPMRYFKELELKKFETDSERDTAFLYTEDEDILWTQSDKFNSNQHQHSDYAILPFSRSGRDIAKRMETALSRFAKLAKESETCRNAQPF